MPLYHAKTITIPDEADTAIARPSDWNSQHIQAIALSGNTSGLSSFTCSDVVFQGGNNLTLSAAVAAGIATIAFSGLPAPSFANSNGVTFGEAGGIVTASVATDYAAGDHAHTQYFASSQSSLLQHVSATSGITSNAAHSTHLHAQYLTTAQPPGAYLTTAAQSNHSHGNPTLALTNLSGTTASASNGLTISLSAAAGGGGADGYNIIGVNGGTVGSAATVQLSNSNNVSFGLNGSTITASASYPAQTVQPAVGQLNGSSGTLSLAVGSSLSASSNGSTITFGLASNITTALQSAGAYLTTAAQSGHSHGNPNLNLTNLSGTTASNSAGLTLSLSAAAQSAQPVAFSAANGSALFSTLTFANSNGVSFSSGTQGVFATVKTDYLTTAMQSGASANFAATGFTTTTGAGAVVAGTHDTAGLKLAVPAFLTTAQPPGAYLTTARASNDGIGLNTALTANGVSMTANSAGLSLNVPAFLTTAMQSQMSSNYMSTAERGNYFYTSNNTFANSTHSHGNPTLALTNLSGTTASDSNGLTLSLSAGAGGAGGGGNVIAALGTTVGNTTGTVCFYDNALITFGLDGNTITASHNGLTTAAPSNHLHGFSFSGVNISATVNTQSSSGIAMTLSGPAPAGVAVAMLATNGIATTLKATGTLSLASTVGNYGQVYFSSAADGSVYGAANVHTLFVAQGNTAPGYQTQWTPDQQAFWLSGMGNVSIGFDTLNSAMLISGAGGGGGVAISGSTNVRTSGTVNFSASNGVSFGLNTNGVMTGSVVTNYTTNNIQTSQSSLFQHTSATTAIVSDRAYSTHSHGNPTLNLTNISGTTASGSNGLTLSLSAANPGGGAAINISAGTTSGNVQTIQFANSNGVSFGLNGSTITASAAGGGGGATATATMWFPYNEAVNSFGQQGQGTLHLAPVPTPGQIGADGIVSIDRLCFPILWSHATNSTGSATISQWFGLYSRENTTASRLTLVHSTSISRGVTFSGTQNSSILNGLRLLTCPWTTTIGDNRWIVAVGSRTTSGGANATVSQLLINNIASNFSGIFGAASATSAQWPLGWGIYSATTSGLPASIAYSQIVGTGSLGMRNPEWFMINSTA